MSSVKVNEEKCIGCGACVAIAPNNFDFNDEGLSKVIGEEITEETIDACEACPVFAIEVEAECCCDDCCCGDDCECGEEEQECDCEHCHCCE